MPTSFTVALHVNEDDTAGTDLSVDDFASRVKRAILAEYPDASVTTRTHSNCWGYRPEVAINGECDMSELWQEIDTIRQSVWNGAADETAGAI